MASDLLIKLPAELFAPAESSHFEGKAAIPLIVAGPDDLRFDDPIDYEVDVTNTGDALLVQGQVRGVALIACARCLDDVTVPFEGDIEGYFLINSEVDHPEDLDDDEFDVLPDDHIIDLMPLIQAALFIEAPTIPLCREDCKGICPQCGANLNDGPCGCTFEEDLAFEEAKNPFAVLKGLSFDDVETDACADDVQADEASDDR